MREQRMMPDPVLLVGRGAGEPAMSDDDGSRRYLIGGAAAACAVCCAPPLMALLGIAVTGVVATVASLLFAGAVFAMVVAALSVSAVLARRNGWPRRARVPESRHDGGPLPDPVRPGSTG